MQNRPAISATGCFSPIWCLVVGHCPQFLLPCRYSFTDGGRVADFSYVNFMSGIALLGLLFPYIEFLGWKWVSSSWSNTRWSCWAVLYSVFPGHTLCTYNRMVQCFLLYADSFIQDQFRIVPPSTMNIYIFFDCRYITERELLYTMHVGIMNIGSFIMWCSSFAFSVLLRRPTPLPQAMVHLYMWLSLCCFFRIPS